MIDPFPQITVCKEGLTEAQAYRRLQRISMDKNKPMKEVAEAIILMLG
jgi:response regulator NasT